MQNVGFYLPIAKVDRERRMVFGYASTPTRDLDGEVIELEAIKAALPGYMEWRNVREMHQPSAVGVAKEANVDERGLYVGAKIVDDEAWKKVLEGVYNGFSIGGNVTGRDGATITGLDLVEISLVDRPANPDCRIEVIKAAGFAGAARAPAGEAAGVTMAREEVGIIGRLLAKLAGGGAEKRGKEPYGDVEYADPGYQSDGRKRYPLATEEQIRAAWSYIHEERNAAKYSAEEVAAIEERIIAAWKRIIDEKGPPEQAGASRAPGNDSARARSGASGKMSETEFAKRAASGRHHEHIQKAMHHLEEAHRNCTAGMECVARAHRVLEEKDVGDDGFDAPAHLLKAGEHFERAGEHHVLAHHHMAQAMGRHVGERGEEPGDAEEGVYEPGGGLVPLGQRYLTGGRVPGYDADRPYPGKAAAVALKAAQDELVRKAEEAAYLRGKVEALEKMPAAPKPRHFTLPRGSMGVGEADEPSATEKLLKGVNLDAATPAERQAAGAKLIGNMIANMGTFGRPVVGDPTFRGGAGR